MTTRRTRTPADTDARALLRTAGHRATPTRSAIISALTRAEAPLSVDEIWEMIGKTRANQATVYRAVNDLVASGLVREVHVGHTHAHFELSGDHHHHLVCESCGAIEDVRTCPAPELEERILERSAQFASVRTHALELFGVCRACSKK